MREYFLMSVLAAYYKHTRDEFVECHSGLLLPKEHWVKTFGSGEYLLPHKDGWEVHMSFVGPGPNHNPGSWEQSNVGTEEMFDELYQDFQIKWLKSWYDMSFQDMYQESLWLCVFIPEIHYGSEGTEYDYRFEIGRQIDKGDLNILAGIQGKGKS